MMERIEARNRAIWEGHTRVFENATHAIGGIGLGFLLCSAVGERARTYGFALVAVSALLHVYAFATAPVRTRRGGWFASRD